jgi:hypothetical protein
MNKFSESKSGRILLAAALVLALMGAGRAGAGERSVDLGGASSATVEIKMGGQTLEVIGGATALMNGTFDDNPKAPAEITYQMTEGRGNLSIRQATLGPVSKRVGNEWNVRLNNQAPLALTVDFSTGDCDLKLVGLTLTALKAKLFSGNGTVNLTGPHPQLNQLDLDMDYGELAVDMKGQYPALTKFAINLNRGILNLDLAGDWTQNTQATISSASATQVITVPKNIGVKVEVQSPRGTIKTTGLKMTETGVYVNDAYGKSSVTLNLIVRNKSGAVDLELAE